MAFGAVPDDQLTGYGSSLTIEELTPAGPNFKPRRVVLIGPSLPHMGAEWGHENNIVTTWYPGNGVEGTQQVLGPRELPSTWSGEWRRTMMGRAPTIYVDEAGQVNRLVSPHILREVLEDISRAGARLRVTWAVSGATFTGSPKNGGATHEEDVKIVREGRIKTFKTPITRHTDIEWSMEFHWVSRGGTSDKVVSTREDDDLATSANGLLASMNASIAASITKVFAINSEVDRSASNFSLGQLESIASAPLAFVTSLTRSLQQNVSQFKQVGDIARLAVAQPATMARAVDSLAANTVSVAKSFTDSNGRQPCELQASKSRVATMLRATNYFASVAIAAQLNAREAQALRDKVKRAQVSGANRGTLSVRESSTTRRGVILAVYTAKTGDTPQNVSTRFYGGPDHGSDILHANRMPLYTPSFPPGQILIIPALVNAPRS